MKDMLGKVFTKVEQSGDDELQFHAEDGKVHTFYHDQDCCEHVWIESVVGDLKDLEGSPLLLAEESTNNDPGPNSDFSTTWTFYKFATLKGYVDVRWCGESNGYYSESVDYEVK